MKKHEISVRHTGLPASERLFIPLIKHWIRHTLTSEGVDVMCEVNVLVTDDSGMRELNREHRGIDESTDVLSFPLQEFPTPGWHKPPQSEFDPETGVLPLGDIVISAKQVKKQAQENFQPIERETAYLAVHSVLHLLGYDHEDEAEGKKQMRTREKEILEDMQQ